jgi:hypothetical protein
VGWHWSSRQYVGAAPWVVELYDANGRMIESRMYRYADHLSSTVDEMYHAARRQALDVDQTIEDLLGDLDDG